jgi:phosphohistidine phosphatase SixA/ADP-ribose pyrophosphatase YjhB (NUDIX family)
VLLVHRPRYDDWSLPKGKRLPDEGAEECALREVEEETGYRCEIRWELADARYLDGQGRRKHVRYFAMRPLGGEFVGGQELDEVRWVARRAVTELLSYPHDAAVVASFGYDGRERLMLIRHASAGDRKSWQGDDRLRPLDARGALQAERLVGVLAGHRVARILSSPYLRCVQTVEPLASGRGLAVERREELAEGAGLAAFYSLGDELRAAAVSVHGDLVEELLGESRRKGSTTLFEERDGGLQGVAKIPPPA